jgi:UDP-GlcNAc3NAcA epimerase
MQALLLHCKYVITDSGGLQREAFFAKKPSLVLMTKPFWPEVIEFGPSLNCISQKEEILSSFSTLQNLNKDFESNPFGEGNAAEIIINHLLNNTILTNE